MSLDYGDPYTVKMRVLAQGDFTLWSYACFVGHEWVSYTISNRVEIGEGPTQNDRDVDCTSVLMVRVWVYDGNDRVGAVWYINMEEKITKLGASRARI